jgi:hypothetical protein
LRPHFLLAVEGMPLRSRPRKDADPVVTAAGEFEEAEVMKSWHLTPAQWAQEPRWSRAEMIAFERANRKLAYSVENPPPPRATRG